MSCHSCNAVNMEVLIKLISWLQQWIMTALWFIAHDSLGTVHRTLSNSSSQGQMVAILKTTFSGALSWMKMLEFWFKFHWNLFLGVQLTINQHWFRQWLDAKQATSHYLNQCWPSSLTHICSTRERWVSELDNIITAGSLVYIDNSTSFRM